MLLRTCCRNISLVRYVLRCLYERDRTHFGGHLLNLVSDWSPSERSLVFMGFLKQLSDTSCFMCQLQQLAVQMTWIVSVLWDPLAVFSHLWSCQNHWGSLTVFSWDEKIRQREGCSIITLQWQLNDRWAYRQTLCTVVTVSTGGERQSLEPCAGKVSSGLKTCIFAVDLI